MRKHKLTIRVAPDDAEKLEVVRRYIGARSYAEAVSVMIERAYETAVRYLDERMPL